MTEGYRASRFSMANAYPKMERESRELARDGPDVEGRSREAGDARSFCGGALGLARSSASACDERAVRVTLKAA
jgi:hypothetical protein